MQEFKWVGGGSMLYLFLNYLNDMGKFSCFEVKNDIKILVFLQGCQLLSTTDIPV